MNFFYIFICSLHFFPFLCVVIYAAKSAVSVKHLKMSVYERSYLNLAALPFLKHTSHFWPTLNVSLSPTDTKTINWSMKHRRECFQGLQRLFLNKVIEIRGTSFAGSSWTLDCFRFLVNILLHVSDAVSNEKAVCNIPWCAMTVFYTCSALNLRENAVWLKL